MGVVGAREKWEADVYNSKEKTLALYRRKRNLWLQKWKDHHRAYGAKGEAAKKLFKTRWDKFHQDYEKLRAAEGERFE